VRPWRRRVSRRRTFRGFRYQGEGSQGGVPSEVPRGKGLKEAYLPRYQGGRVQTRRTFRGTKGEGSQGDVPFWGFRYLPR
jgi:hypothetical protein